MKSPHHPAQTTPIITLLTDFGLADPYVGQMKGVILSRAPQARLVDLTHAVPPQDVLAGALLLESAVAVFPAGTVHLAVVDPGVGGDRSPVAAATDIGLFVGPDNGLFSLCLRRWPVRRAVRLSNPRFHRQPVSPTFHGRDIFAPAAAHLAAGGALHDLGEAADGLVMLDLPAPQAVEGGLLLTVLRVDHFGNLITNLAAADLTRWLEGAPPRQVVVEAGHMRIEGLARTFAEVEKGAFVAYLGSSGRLEVAQREGSAARELAAAAGSLLYLRKRQG